MGEVAQANSGDTGVMLNTRLTSWKAAVDMERTQKHTWHRVQHPPC